MMILGQIINHEITWFDGETFESNDHRSAVALPPRFARQMLEQLFASGVAAGCDGDSFPGFLALKDQPDGPFVSYRGEDGWREVTREDETGGSLSLGY